MGTFLRMMKSALILIVALCLLSCDHGLAPPPSVEPGFGGIVYFEKGTWPSSDSLVNLWVFASEVYPLDSAKVYQGLFSNPPTVFLLPVFAADIRPNTDSVSYTFKLPVATYKYVGVIQQVALDLNIHNLRVVGLYGTTDSPPLPIPVIVNDGEFTSGITFRVNFRIPPPQPF